MDLDAVRMLFNGNEDNILYYHKLRNILLASENDCSPSPCDPSDETFVERIKESQWQHSPVLKATEDILYLDGDMHGYQSKQTALDSSEVKENDCCSDSSQAAFSENMEQEDASALIEFECGYQGCTKTFSSLSAYESHYHSCHHYTCATCRRVFVSSFMLDIHIQENHDSYFQILCSRIDMFRCLVESCDLKFRTPELRKKHLIEEHRFPANFYFHKPVSENRSKGVQGEQMDTTGKTESQSERAGFSKAKSKTRQPGTENSSKKTGRTENSSEKTGRTENSSEKTGTGAPAGMMIPTSVCFGRGSQKSFQRKPYRKKRIQVETEMEQQ
ncbi:zinc finger protein 511 [Aplysia californica]|uniref:Zinc finger protein 511 n=1 Tax=Aplysia californica TaxID=6500 RepID=A0ABM0JE75_APLCA|nr:zinc finger protein 511 [Aplysia californica]XP_005091674.1 zinc finger protein 511 [Aplysia californica]